MGVDQVHASPGKVKRSRPNLPQSNAEVEQRACLAINIVRSALECHNRMASFAEAGVSENG
jgi:NaMN:DMB phosphoribosyltransferase